MCDSCTLLFFKLNYINLRLVLHYPKNDITKLGTSYLIDLILLKVIFIFRNTFFLPSMRSNRGQLWDLRLAGKIIMRSREH